MTTASGAAHGTRLRGQTVGHAVAMQLVEAGRFEPVRVEVRDPGPGEVVVRLEGCGVCGSNLPVWEGRPWFEYPLAPGAPGHEGWGEVVGVGAGVDEPRVGQRVASLSFNAFCEYETVPANRTVVIPDGSAGRPAPGEPLACAMNVFERSGIGPGSVVAVVGVGFLGALLVQLAARAGARVIACSRRAFSREVAAEMGAVAAFAPDQSEEMIEHVTSANGGELCDVAIEAGGVQQTLDAASALVRTRGRLVVAGFHQDGPRRVDMQDWNWRGLDVINAHEREPSRYLGGMRRAFAAIAEGRLNPDPLLTHRLPLSRIDEAMRLLRDRPDGFVKALVHP